MRGKTAVALALVLLSLPALAGAQALVPVGPEFQVNTFTTADEARTAVAMDNAGNFVVTWNVTAVPADTNGTSGQILGRRYDNAGVALDTPEFVVNTYTTDQQRYPAVAGVGSGFVVVWQSFGQDGNDRGVFAQRFGGGAAQGPEFRVNTYTTNSQDAPQVATDADGDFVVVWKSRNQAVNNTFSVHGQRYSSNGDSQGSEFKINATNSIFVAGTIRPDASIDDDGDTIIVWDSFGAAALDFFIYGQRYDSNGNARGTEFVISDNTIDFQRSPSVSMDSIGKR